MSDKITEVESEEQFGEITQTGVVLIDFFAPWCGPCRMQTPVLEKIADSIGNTAKIIKVNTDELPGLAGRFNVSSIPTLVLMKNGDLVDQFVGLQQESSLKTAIESAAR